MFNQQSIPEFENLIQTTLSKTYMHDQDRIELETELKQHLYDYYNDLIGVGIIHEQAVKQVVVQFGNFKKIRKQINRNYPNTLREVMLREFIIGSILIMAVIIGPTLLIYRYRMTSLLAALPIPFLTLLIAIPFQHLILKRQKSWKIPLIATIAIYLYLMGTQIHSSGVSIDTIIKQIFVLKISSFVNGSLGVFTLNTIHLFWILILLLQFVKDGSKTKVWQKMIYASFQYWGIIGLGIAVVISLPTNSAANMVFINVFFITAVLEQVLLDRTMAFFSNRLSKRLDANI